MRKGRREEKTKKKAKDLPEEKRLKLLEAPWTRPLCSKVVSLDPREAYRVEKELLWYLPSEL